MTLELLKPDLPNMPDEVIEVWLMTHYSRFGWPPSSNRDWKYIFGIDRDFEYFQRMNWERGDIEITPRDLTPKALNVLLGMVQRDYFGVFNEYSFMSDSKERLQSCISYMNEHGKFPKPVILHATPEGYEIMDGNHRMVAFFYTYGFFNIPNGDLAQADPKISLAQSYWVGTNVEATDAA